MFILRINFKVGFLLLICVIFISGAAIYADVGLVDNPASTTAYEASKDQANTNKTGENVWVSDNYLETLSEATITVDTLSIDGIAGRAGVGGQTLEAPISPVNGGNTTIYGAYGSSANDTTILMNGNLSATGGQPETNEVQQSGDHGLIGSTGTSTVDGGSGSIGGQGADGGAGGDAVVYGVTIKSGSDNTISGGTFSISAVASNGANGGIGGQGGNGGIGGNGDNVSGTYGESGEAGTNGGAGGNGGAAGNGGTGGDAFVKALDFATISKTSVDLRELTVTAKGGDGGIGGAGGNGGIGGAGGIGGTGNEGTPGLISVYDATGGTVSLINGGTGGTGGVGGNGGNGGIGGAGGNGGVGGKAEASGILAGNSRLDLTIDTINVSAVGGQGGQGGSGGAGGNGGIAGSGGNGGRGGDAGSWYYNTYGTVTDTYYDPYYDSYGNYIEYRYNTYSVLTGHYQGSGAFGATGVTGAAGTAGTTGANGESVTSAAGGDATAAGVIFTNANIKLTTTAINATATAGNGGSANVAQGVNAGSNGANASAKAVIIENTTLDLISNNTLTVAATASNASNTNSATAIRSVDSTLNVTAGGDVNIIANATGANNSAIAMSTVDTVMIFDAGVGTPAARNIAFTGEVNIVNGSIVLRDDSTVSNSSALTNGNMNLSDTKVYFDEDLTVVNQLTLSGNNKISFYEVEDYNQANNTNNGMVKNQYRDNTDYQQIKANQISNFGTVDIWMRTNAAKNDNIFMYSAAAGGDLITSDQLITGGGTYKLHIFDQGMRSGFGFDAGDTITAQQMLIANADTTGTYATETINYDNTIWNYSYNPEVTLSDNNLYLSSLGAVSFRAGTAQRTALDSALATAALEYEEQATLIDHINILRQNSEKYGLWFSKVGGKLRVEGDPLYGRDDSMDYNGFRLGIDKYNGYNWHVGAMIGTLESDAAYEYGSGHIDSNHLALYATFVGEKGYSVDIIAKHSNISTDFVSIGGTFVQANKANYDTNSTSVSIVYSRRKQKDSRDNWYWEPVIQATYGHINSVEYIYTHDDGTANIRNNPINSVVLSGGVLVGKQYGINSNFYMKTTVLHDFDSDVETIINGDRRESILKDSIGGTGIEVVLGINHTFNSNYSLYFNVGKSLIDSIDRAGNVDLGLQYRF